MGIGGLMGSALSGGGSLGSWAGSFGGDLLGSAVNYHFERKLLGRQQKFAKMMSDTAHQRQVRDLRAAGLNPILSVTGGKGASTPTPSAAHTPGTGGTAKMLAMAQIRKLNAETSLTNEKTKVVGPAADIMSEVSSALDAFKQAIGSNNRGVIPSTVDNLSNAIKAKQEADKIRKKPGIELTSHSKNRLIQRKNAQRYSKHNRRSIRARRNK